MTGWGVEAKLRQSFRQDRGRVEQRQAALSLHHNPFLLFASYFWTDMAPLVDLSKYGYSLTFQRKIDFETNAVFSNGTSGNWLYTRRSLDVVI